MRARSSLPLIAGLLARVANERRQTHPLVRLNAAVDGVDRNRAVRTECALVRVRRLFPAYFTAKSNQIVEDPDPRNVVATLGEFRALSDLAYAWPNSITTPSAGADFDIQVGNRSLRIEVTTVGGATKNLHQKLEEWSRDAVSMSVTAHAPFSHPDGNREQDTKQGNAVSRLAGIKQKEHQAMGDAPTLLWMDFDSHIAFPLSIGEEQTQPLVGGPHELASGALWWMDYGRKGDPVFDSWKLAFSDHCHYLMEFDGRFARASKFRGTICAVDGVHIFHQNPYSEPSLSDDWIVELLQLPGARYDRWWVDWPDSRVLSRRVDDARAQSHRLLTLPHPTDTK